MKLRRVIDMARHFYELSENCWEYNGGMYERDKVT